MTDTLNPTDTPTEDSDSLRRDTDSGNEEHAAM